MSASLQSCIDTLLQALVAGGKEVGAQVAVYQNGKEIADVFAGVADSSTRRLVDRDTLFPIFSTLKGPTATVIHILAERGQLAYDTPIATYWPEFAANGKEAITVRHALCHTSGIPYLPDDGIGQEQLNDWDFMCDVIAQLKPAWPPGTKQFYHAHTYSWILGELCRRVDGRPFQRFVDEEINQRLGMQGLYSGLPAELDPRVAIIEPAPEFTETLSPPPRTNAPVMCPAHEWINTLPARRICHPGVNGLASARALARHYAALLPGGVDGVELLPPERVKLATEPQPLETGWVEGESDTRGLGYQLGIRSIDWGSDPRAFGHGGHGGSLAFANPSLGLAVAITRNRFSHFDLRLPVWNEIRTSLGIS